MDLEVEMFGGCGSAEVGLRVAEVGRKVWRDQAEDIQDAGIQCSQTLLGQSRGDILSQGR